MTQHWRFRQVFGERDPVDEPPAEDLISAVEFDSTGDYLATGDRSGRVVVFESSDVQRNSGKRVGSDGRDDSPATRNVQYRFHCEFQSHEPQFDYLKSVEIEERINKIRWSPASAGGPRLLLSTNDKTIKLWKVYNKQVKMVTARAVGAGGDAGGSTYLRMPMIQQMQTLPTAALKRTYSNGHGYHINALSFSPDGETYLSSDDLRINLWSLSHNSLTFTIVDLKPDDMDDLSEVITMAGFHPRDASLLAYSSSRGNVCLCDMRERSSCGRSHGRHYAQPPPTSDCTFFADLIASVSDVKFSHCGRYLLARDYMTLKVWDLNMERAPIRSFKVHDHYREKLAELYESECIFDKFDCEWSGDGRHVCTGSYDNRLLVWDVNGDGHHVIESTCASPKSRSFKDKLGISRHRDTGLGRAALSKKVLYHAYHPQRDLVAIGARNSLYLFAA